MDAAHPADYRPLLSPDERARAVAYRAARDVARFTVRRGHLRLLLSDRLGRAPETVEVTADTHGKLSVPGIPLAFNLSHSRQIALYAFAPTGTIGCDIEYCDSDFDCDRTAARFFAAEEIAALRALPPARRRAGFFACWTRKEAYLKATGQGFSVPLDSFAVSVDPDAPARFLRGGEGCEIRSFSPLPGFRAAEVIAAGRGHAA